MVTGNINPLCVDLDGTLIRTDILVESALALVKKNPLFLFEMLLWLIKGKAYFKQQIAARVDIDVTLLPYNEPLIAYLRNEKANGRRLILATASNIRYAKAVALHLDLFDEILASESSFNLSGARKRDRLVAAYGEGGFAYAANSRVDLPIWASANSAILVDAPSKVEAQVRKSIPITNTFNTGHPGIRTYLKAVRLHQWLKNVLVFIPLLAAHQWENPQILVQATLAYLAFCFIASSVYLLNDLFDLESDRKHPSKCHRPFAAGTIPPVHGLIVLPLLIISAIMMAMTLPMMFMTTLGVYYATTLAYSLRLKQFVLVDVLVLAGLYTIRVIGGGAATDIDVSFWLLAFSMFFFLSLAMVKRYSELLQVQARDQVFASGRGYQVIDLESLAHFGITSGYASVLVMSLYINSGIVGIMYRNHQVLWLVCPLLLFWISRIWLLTRRNHMHEDPVIFAIRDRHSHWLLLTMAVIFWLAK